MYYIIISILKKFPKVKYFIKKINPQKIILHIKKKYQLLFYKSYTTKELICHLKKMGLFKNKHIFLHSSWDQFFHYTGSPKELIEAILNEIGPKGTLAMPAFPQDQDPNKVFNVKRTPSGAGFITEIFRRYPGVLRSINLVHSVIAIGDQAEYLTKDHHLSKTPWDEFSPYYRLKKIDALIIGLGVGKNLSVATALHCIDSLLKDKLPFFSNIFNKTITYSYKNHDGNIKSHTLAVRRHSILNTKNVAKYMDKNQFLENKISNLDVYSIHAKYLINKALDLATKGITMYAYPKPQKKLFIPFSESKKC